MLSRSHLRNHPRAAFHGTVSLCHGRDSVVTQCADIGVGGVLLRTAQPLTLRSLVTLRIQLPGERAFTVVGRVVHLRRGNAPGAGVEFLGLMPRDRQRVDAFVLVSTMPMFAHAA